MIEGYRKDTDMSDMLGASTSGLADLVGRLHGTSSAIGGCQANTQRICGQLVEAVRHAASTALTQIQGEMQALRGEVVASATASEAVAWTGVNRETFVGAYHAFDGSMSAAETATGQTFGDFHTAVDGVAAELEAYVAELSTSLASAVESVDGMSAAVQGQLDTLEATMNTGMSAA